MIMRDIRDPLVVLLQDAADAEDFFDKNPDSQFARRTFVRTTFSTIEGIVWILKTACFGAQPIKGLRRMSPAEYALLKEETYELKSNGEIKTSAKFLRLPDNIRFVFKLINRLFNASIDIQETSTPWQEFKQGLEVRNRITHPKNTLTFNITDEEISLCKRVTSWSVTITAQAINAFFKLNTDGTLRDEPLFKF